MADILNRCLKCKCSLAPNDKTSKLLPCLHTMCEECISGRTDVAEKIKRMKEEKEEKERKLDTVEKTIKDECENKIKEEVIKTEERTNEEHLEESVVTVVDDKKSSSCVGSESAEPTETKQTSEQAKSPEPVGAENLNGETKDEDGEKKADDGEKKAEDGEKKADDGEKKAEDQDGEKKADDAEKKDDREKKDFEEKEPALETVSEKHEEEKSSENSNTTPSTDDRAEAGEASASEKKGNADSETKELPADNVDKKMTENPTDDGKAEAETSLSENQPSDENGSENQNRPNPDEESMEVVEVEEKDPAPPTPVPLTECPVCREPFNPETLIDNVFIRKQAGTGEDGQGTEQKCTGCETNPANSYCLQCDDWLCADCVNAHKRVRMTKDHQLTSLEEALANKGSSAGPVEVSMMCRLHPKEKLTLFCERCEVLTCRDCQLLQHQEHKYQFLQEAADTYKAKLTGSLSLMKDRREVLKRYQTEIEERLFKVKREKSDLQQDILKQADVIVRAVRQAVWTVLSSLHSFTDAAAKRLSREVGDVRDLVGKFDHCISFMDGILDDGFGLPLLYSKTIVETKCRKVYHTHMEPQSLKGQLNIQYRHDVPSVLRSLPHIGAIYVNGSKYPPEKSAPQNQQSSSSSSSSSSSAPQANSSSQQSNNAYRGSAPVNSAVGVVGAGLAPISQPGLSHHLASQSDRNLYMQMMMSRQSSHTHTHTHTAPPSQGPTLSLPGSRRVGSLGPAQRGWGGAGQQLGLPGANQGGGGGLMVGSMLAQGQSQMMAAVVSGGRGPPAFTPMRLHHRPVEPNHMGGQPTMVLGGPLPQQHRQQPQHAFSTLPAPPPLRSPMGQPQLQYRGAADGLHMNSGGQAAMSGVRRSSSMIDGNPDPARPASGGHNTPERPLSSEGAASSMRVKSEPQESLDCVITSASFKNKKPTMVTGGSSLGELQKNLDEVIRGVPLDLGDNLEQINGADSLGISHLSSSLGSAGGLTIPRVTSPGAVFSSASVTSNKALSSVSPSLSSTSPSPSTTTTTTTAAASMSSGETRGVSEESSNGGDPGQVNMETDGHQVQGYATGNSMPGFTLAAVESADPNDDYCASCHQGGDVLCCDKCPRVFHLQCHVPVLSTVPSGTFVCTLCEEGLTTEGTEDGLPSSGKRKSPSSVSDKDLKVCQRVMLEMYCHPSSIPFHEPVNRAVPNYYKIITHPMDFSTIKSKLSMGHFDHYTSVVTFLDDCRLVFHNCAVYNSETSEVGKAGKIVRGFFERLVDRHMPEYSVYIRRQQHETPEGDGRMETDRKKRRLTPPPAHSGHSERPTASPVQ